MRVGHHRGAKAPAAGPSVRRGRRRPGERGHRGRSWSWPRSSRSPPRSASSCRWSLPTVEFFSEVSSSSSSPTPRGRRCSPTSTTASCRCWSRTLMVTLIAIVIAVPLGHRLGDLPGRVRQPPGPRRRSSRSWRCSPASRPWCTASSRWSRSTRSCATAGRATTSPEFQNLLVAGIVMGIMIVPTIASLSEDAMTAVPRSLREGAYALASTKMQVATRVVVPAALSGIVAAIVLGISRALGETMIVTIAGGLKSDGVDVEPDRGRGDDDRVHRRRRPGRPAGRLAGLPDHLRGRRRCCSCSRSPSTRCRSGWCAGSGRSTSEHSVIAARPGGGRATVARPDAAPVRARRGRCSGWRCRSAC